MTFVLPSSYDAIEKEDAWNFPVWSISNKVILAPPPYKVMTIVIKSKPTKLKYNLYNIQNLYVYLDLMLSDLMYVAHRVTDSHIPTLSSHSAMAYSSSHN